MGCGLPCVGTDIPGFRELLQDGETGFLCKSDAEDVARKLQEISNYPGRSFEMGRKAREYVAEKFEIDKLLADETNALAELALKSRHLKKLPVPQSQA